MTNTASRQPPFADTCRTGRKFITPCCTASVTEFSVDGQFWLASHVAGHGWRGSWRGSIDDINDTGTRIEADGSERRVVWTPERASQIVPSIPASPSEALAAAIEHVRQHISANTEHHDALAEDSYADRNDARDRGRRLRHVLHRLETTKNGTVDLGMTIEDWGHDDEAATDAATSGLDPVDDVDRDIAAHQAVMRRLSGVVDQLRTAGFTVITEADVVARYE